MVDSRYELGERIASGGMADVYAARDRTLDRRVAIKRLRADLPDESARNRFTREAYALAGFSHPNAVAVFDAGDDATGPYIVMELVDGPTLAAYLRERGRLSFEEATKILEQTLSVLGAAHARGIVHRDVKPANVLLTEDSHVKLADFGIAKILSDNSGDITMHGQVMGTPKYLAPERIAGRDATAQSDLYSVAVIGYEMVAGAPPFRGENVAATLLLQQRAPIPSLLEVRPDAPPEYVAAIERGLAKDPAARFATAEEMREALTRPAYDETMAAHTLTMPVPPTPLSDPEPTPTPTPPPRRPAAAPATLTPPQDRRRPRWPWVVVGVLLLGLVAGAILTLAADEDPLPSARRAQDPIATTTPPTVAGTIVPQVASAPLTLDELIAALAVNPTRYGERGPELLAGLQSFRADPSSDEAADLIANITEWVADGELDQGIGTAAIEFLSPSVTTNDEDDEGNSGRGNDGEPPGQEKKDDD